MSKYEMWLDDEKKWIKSYQKKIQRLWLLVYLPASITIVGGLNIFLALDNQETVSEGIVKTIPAMIFIFLVCMIVIYSLRSSKYIKVIKRSLDELGMDEEEKELFASEILEANKSHWRMITFKYNGHGQSNIPARLRVTPHYAYLQGGNPYANIVRLSDIKLMKKVEERKKHTQYGTRIRTYEYYVFYTIYFYKNSIIEENELPDYGMGFFDVSLRDEAFELIRKQSTLQ